MHYEHLFGKYPIALDTVSMTIARSAGAKRSPTGQMRIWGPNTTSISHTYAISNKRLKLLGFPAANSIDAHKSGIVCRCPCIDNTRFQCAAR